MEAIFASKFYKASSRKDEIRAALENPINHELVQQLKDYIDDSEWRRVEELKQPEEPIEEPVPDDAKESEISEHSESDSDSSESTSNSAPSTPHIADHHLSNMLKEEESDNIGDVEVSEVSEESNNTEDSSSVSESESISELDSVEATTSVVVTTFDDISKQIDSIAGILNADAETSGVRRCTVKSDSELWIYYNDSINLNNVMEPVISRLNSSNYSYLDFNRLARTDNAIVFSISESAKPIIPESDIDE